jgi:hypothetical protein
MKDFNDIGMRPFFQICPETARRDTRSVHVNGMPPVPDDEYGFLDFYCQDLNCDCRRSVIQVLSRKNGIVATFNYGWESADFYTRWMRGNAEEAEEMAGLTLEPFGEQSPFSAYLLALFESMLEDPEYASRFPRHYLEFKNAIRAKTQTVGRQGNRASRRSRVRR